jgi:hypothetical protein
VEEINPLPLSPLSQILYFWQQEERQTDNRTFPPGTIISAPVPFFAKPGRTDLREKKIFLSSNPDKNQMPVQLRITNFPVL